MQILKPEKSNSKSLKKKCISLSGDIVTYEGVCLSCGASSLSGKIIDPAHIIPRTYALTVANTKNQVPLCRECHTFYTLYPLLWKKFIDDKLPGRRIMMEAIANSGKKPDWEKIYEGLKIKAAYIFVE